MTSCDDTYCSNAVIRDPVLKAIVASRPFGALEPGPDNNNLAINLDKKNGLADEKVVIKMCLLI
jgi:hypothetical protein